MDAIQEWSRSREYELVFCNSNCKAILWVTSSQCPPCPFVLFPVPLLSGEHPEYPKLSVDTTPTPTLSALAPHSQPPQEAERPQHFMLMFRD